MKRITVITGHFGSGKTELAVNMAMKLKTEHEKVALLDLDIANPYFRSRERQKMLEDAGIQVYYNTFGYDITEDLPAISAVIRTPLEDPECTVIVDAGGNDSGARILKQFSKYFNPEDSMMLCVLNGNRPETDTVEGMIEHIESIENETGIRVDGLINNTHLLLETTVADVVDGFQLCRETAERTSKKLMFNVCRKELAEGLQQLVLNKKIYALTDVYTIKLYMRPSWLDL